MLILQVINNSYPQPSTSNNYLPAISFGFVVFSYFLEKIISNHSKKKQILREWYSHSLLEPTLLPINELFEVIKLLAYKHIAIFDEKYNLLDAADFLRYKGKINSDFQKIKEGFYTEYLVPIYHNYPEIAEDATSFLLTVQDNFIFLFGGTAIDKANYEQFINDLYIEKGKLLATLRKPLN